MTTLVTGGAGFIGGELVAALAADGEPVTVVDDLSTAQPAQASLLAGHPHVSLVIADVREPDALRDVIAGHDRVVHLASSTDIAGGFRRPELDFAGIVEATERVCEAMLASGATELWFASSGVVYGADVPRPSREDHGPLRPASHYAAAKLAAEAIVTGFALLYGWRALIFRFGNTIGGASDHGLVHDLVVKALRDPTRIEVLGDGRQRKPFIHVADLVRAMRHAATAAAGAPVTTLNIGYRETLSVWRTAEVVLDALGIPATDDRIVALGGDGGWAGDTALVEFDIGALERLGWRPTFTAEEAVRMAARETADRLLASGAPLVTSVERNQARRSVPAALAPMAVATGREPAA